MHVLIFLPCISFLFKVKVSSPTHITTTWSLLQRITDPSSNFLCPQWHSLQAQYSFLTTTIEPMRNLIFEEPEVRVPGDTSSSLRYAWESIRAPVIIPLLKLAVILCSIMSIMLFVERVAMAIVILVVKVLGKKRYTKYNLEAMKQKLERNKRFPMVLIQIPMYNEKEVTCFLISKFCTDWN